MSEPLSWEDQAGLYVEGRLGPAERREFEARLEESAELRALVHELESGVVALALAAPRRETPPEVWREIERRIAQETKPKPVIAIFWAGLLRSGWAAAACLLFGWLFYAFWIRRTDQSAHLSKIVSQNHSADVTASGASEHPSTAARAAGEPTTPAGVLRGPPIVSLAATGEIAVLRRQVGELETQINQMSQVLTQQQTLLSDPNRLTFFNLLPPDAGGGTNGALRTPSPEQQRALFIAVARELGWLHLPGTDASANGGQKSKGNDAGVTSSEQPVDFVDVSASGTPAQTSPAPTDSHETVTVTNFPPQFSFAAGTPSDQPAESSPASLAPDGVVPGFFSGSGTNFFVVIGPSTFPADSGSPAVTFNAGGSDPSSQFTVHVGTNPVVVSVPAQFLTGGGPISLSPAAASGGPVSYVGQVPLVSPTPLAPNPTP